MRPIALIVEYDGTEFSGSQLQRNARTVQYELEYAANVVLRGSKRLRMASRTDAGVHATCQVASYETRFRMTTDQIRDGVNSRLPQDVAVREVHFVQQDFDPIRDAVSRTYTYDIRVGAVRSALRYRTELHMRQMPDVTAMMQCAQAFVGTLDFASFAANDRISKPRPTIRRIDEVNIEQSTAGQDARVVITVRGKSYLRQQVRRMVGLLLLIGRDKASSVDLLGYLNNPRRGAFTRPAPAHGLTLTHIEYPPGTFDQPSETYDAASPGGIQRSHLY